MVLFINSKGHHPSVQFSLLVYNNLEMNRNNYYFERLQPRNAMM